MTSSREERDIVETYELGVNSYIVKPVDFDQFTEVVSSSATTGCSSTSRRCPPSPSRGHEHGRPPARS